MVPYYHSKERWTDDMRSKTALCTTVHCALKRKSTIILSTAQSSSIRRALSSERSLTVKGAIFIV